MHFVATRDLLIYSFSSLLSLLKYQPTKLSLTSELNMEACSMRGGNKAGRRADDSSFVSDERNSRRCVALRHSQTITDARRLASGQIEFSCCAKLIPGPRQTRSLDERCERSADKRRKVRRTNRGRRVQGLSLIMPPFLQTVPLLWNMRRVKKKEGW